MLKHDSITQDVTSKAQELGDDAKKAASAKAGAAAENLRSAALDQTTKTADAAEAAASQFDPDSIQAQAARQVADQVEGLAHHLRTTDLDSITQDVSRFARNNPALFIGGAALLGLAATRFLKARDPHRIDYGTAEADPWSTATRGYDVPS